MRKEAEGNPWYRPLLRLDDFLARLLVLGTKRRWARKGASSGPRRSRPSDRKKSDVLYKIRQNFRGGKNESGQQAGVRRDLAGHQPGRAVMRNEAPWRR